MRPMSRSRRFIYLLIVTSALVCLFSPSHSHGFQRPARATPPRPAFLQQAVLFEESSTPPNVAKLVLRNGLTVLVDELKSKPLVSMQTYIHAGTCMESPEGRGAASIISSLVTSRPANMSDGTLEQNIFSLGGMVRRHVGCENTRFEIVVPSSQWKRALNFQLEAIKGPSFEPEHCRVEAGFLAQEVQRSTDNPVSHALAKLLALALQPLPVEPLGESLARGSQELNPSFIKAFYDRFYVPSRMTLVVSGDVVASQVLNEVVQTYGKLSDRRKDKGIAPMVPSAGFRYRLLRGDVAVPQVLFCFRANPEKESEYLAMEILAAHMGMGRGSLLHHRLRDQENLIFGGEARFLRFREFGCLVARVETDPKDVDRAEIGVFTEVELCKRQVISDAELSRAVAQLEMEYWKRLDTVSGRAEALGLFDRIGNWQGRDRYVRDLRRVAPLEIKRVADKYLNLDNCAILEYLPVEVSTERNPTAQIIRTTLEGLTKPSADQQLEKRSKETVPFLKIPESPGKHIFNEIQYPFQVASILRGPEMYIREDHTAPVLTMGLFFPGGKFSENNTSSGITKMMLDLMVQGSPEMRAGRFSHQLELYGAQVLPVVRDDYFGFYFSILSGNFEAGFNLFKQIIKNPVFQKEDVERQAAAQILEIRQHDLMEAAAFDLVSRTLFQGFTYSRGVLGTPDSVSKITPSQLLEWYQATVHNKKPYVVIVGDTKGTSLAQYFVKEFSGSRMQDVGIPDVWSRPLEKGENTELKWGKDWSLVLIGFQAPPAGDEDVYAVSVLEKLAENYGRLSGELRSRLSPAHDVAVRYEQRLRGGRLVAWARTEPGNEASALKAMREELLRTASGPYTYREFRSAINASTGMYWVRSQDRFGQIGQFLESLMAGRGIEGFQNFPNSLQNVSETDVVDVAQRIFNMEKAVVLIMQGRPK